MKIAPRFGLAAAAIVGGFVAVTADAQTVVVVGSGFEAPNAIAVDSAGNVFVADTQNNAVKEVRAVGGYTVVNTLASGNFSFPAAVALDTDGNVFVADPGDHAVKEITSASGYGTVNILAVAAGDFKYPSGVAVDRNGNVFVADSAAKAVEEILAPDYTTIRNLASGNFGNPMAVALDIAGNVFVADPTDNAVKEILAPDYATVQTIAAVNGDFNQPYGVAVDAAGNVYVADTFNSAVKEILASSGYVAVNRLQQPSIPFFQPSSVAVDPVGDLFVDDPASNLIRELVARPSPVVASILPGSRSVQTGTAATVYAAMINGGTTPLDGCSVALPLSAPGALGFSYQTTDPATNAPVGNLDTPVSIDTGSTQTFILTLTGSAAVSAPGLAPAFACDGVTPAAPIPGVNTIDLVYSITPVADVIALAASPTHDGIAHVPVGGAAAFAVASVNLGIGTEITATVDTGAQPLPLAITLCQSNPANGQCLESPSSAVTFDDNAGATPTFSVFLQARASIAFAPASARVFVRFKDAGGNLHGSTSVAVETE